MERLAALFRPRATIVAGFRAHADARVEAGANDILEMLRRRPCTAPQIGKAFGMHPNEVAKYLGNLLRTRRVRPDGRAGEMHFRAQPHWNLDSGDRTSPPE